MKKRFFFKNKYILVAILLFVLDITITWYFLNYVSHELEGNPLFGIDGGYIALMLNFVYLIAVFLLERIVIRKYQTIVTDSKNTFGYIKDIFKQERHDFIMVSFVYAFVIATLASRLMIVIDWLVFAFYRGNFGLTKYAELRMKIPFERYDFIVAILTFFIALILWYKLEHNKSKRMKNI